MKLRLVEIEKLLTLEIMWCETHPDKELSDEFQKGFVAGIRQAQLLIKTAEKSTREHGERVLKQIKN